MDPYLVPYLQLLDDLRRQVADTVALLDDDQINQTLPGLQNTVGILLRHLAGSERYWIGEVAGGRPAYRNRDVEFGRDHLQKVTLLEDLERVAVITRDTLAHLSAADLVQPVSVQSSHGVTEETKAHALIRATQHLAYHLGQLRLMTKLVRAGSRERVRDGS
jgi:uncharacterized damage-inducible protein DinB